MNIKGFRFGKAVEVDRTFTEQYKLYDGYRLDKLRIDGELTSMEEVDELIKTLQIHRYCFLPETKHIEPKYSPQDVVMAMLDTAIFPYHINNNQDGVQRKQTSNRFSSFRSSTLLHKRRSGISSGRRRTR